MSDLNSFFQDGSAQTGHYASFKNMYPVTDPELSNPTFNIPEGLSATRNYTDFTHYLPLTRICLEVGMNYIGFPFDLDKGGASVGYGLSDVLPTEFCEEYLGLGVQIGEYVDESGVAQWSYIDQNTKIWLNDFTIDPAKGYVIKLERDQTVQYYDRSNFNVDKVSGGGVRYLYIYAPIKYPLNSIKAIDGTAGTDVLMPYWSSMRRYPSDAYFGTGTGDLPKQIQDDKGRVLYTNISAEETFSGDLRTFEIGKSYLCKLTAGSTDWSTTVDSSASIGDNHHMSSLSLPSYINDRPRKFKDDPTNWLYNWHRGIRNGLESHNRFKVVFDRLYTWSGHYGMGHRIKFIREQEGKYFYRPLPPGQNDWIIAFTIDFCAPIVCGAQRLNDVFPTINIQSPTKLDPSKWDPYNNSYHQQLVGLPDSTSAEDFTDHGASAPSSYDAEDLGYRSFMGSVSINMLGDGTGDDEGLNPEWPGENKTNRVYFMYYDSVMNKFYWLYSCGVGIDGGADSEQEFLVTGENEYCHIGLSDTSGEDNHTTPRRQYRPIKGPVAHNVVIH